MIQTKSVYTFHSLPTMKYGVGALEEVGHLAQGFGSTVLVVSDPVMKSLGVVDNCLQHLHAQGLQTHVYVGVVSEPVDTYVDEGLKLLQDTQCDVIVSIGGGSCIDTAKAIAVVATNGGYVGDYMKMQKMPLYDLYHILQFQQLQELALKQRMLQSSLISKMILR